VTSPEEDRMTAALELNLPDKQDWTVDDLATLRKDLRYELIDGRLILPFPTGMHQIFGMDVALALRAHCPLGYAPVTDLSLKINNRNEPRPDVVVTKKKHLKRSPVPVEDTILAVEIISPDSHIRDNYTMRKIYAAAGVGSYWVIDPSFDEGVVLTEYVLSDGPVYEMISTTDKVFTTQVPYSVTIDLPALTAERDAVPE
jgi:Uma2 family endonuclease